MEELSPRMGMAYLARSYEIEERLPVCVAGSKAVGKMRVEELTEELRGFPVGEPRVVEDIGSTIDTQHQGMNRGETQSLSVLI